MKGKRIIKKNTTKLNKKIIFIAMCIILFAIIMKCKPVNVGKINKDGKAEYIERIANVTKYEKKKTIEFKNNYDLIDNGIVTDEIYEKLKNNDDTYNLTVTDYLKLENISAKESYNINKAIQTKIINQNTTYSDYFAKTCGFKNKSELLKYTKAVLALADKEGYRIFYEYL